MGNNETITKKKVVGSFLWKLMERLFSQGINLVVQIILARLLLPEDFGSLAIIVAITNYAAIFVQSGLATAIVQREEIDDLDISTLLTASLGITGIFYVILFFVSPLIANFYEIQELTWALRVLSLILFLNAINSVQTAVLSRKMQFRKLFLRTIVAVPIAGAVGIVMAYMDMGIWALVAHNLVNMAVIVIFMSFDKTLRFPLKFSFSRVKKIYAFSGKILLTSIVTGLHDTIRTMVIGKKYSSEDLGYYDKAYTYSNYITLIVNSSISSVLLPTFSRSQNDFGALKGMARRSIKLSAFIMFPVLVGAALICEPLVRLLLTEKWLPCVPYLVLFCFLRIPGCLLSVDRQVYYAIGRSGINLFYEIGLFILNIATLLVTMQYGVIYIAIGATAVEFLGGFLICCISHKTYGYTLWERCFDLFKPFMNTAIMAVCVWAAKFIPVGYFGGMLLQIFFGVLAYIGSAILLRDENFKYLLSTIKQTISKK